MVVFICDRHIVHCYDMLCLPQMLDCCDEAFRSRVEKVFWDGPVVFFTPYSSSLRLLRCVSSSLTEADEP
jgi:hypothetical protein